MIGFHFLLLKEQINCSINIKILYFVVYLKKNFG
jgi:hypothetical protein